MPSYNVHFNIEAIMVVNARNPQEAQEIALADTLRGVGGVYEIGDSMMLLNTIDIAEDDDNEPMIFKTSGDEELWQCPNCDAWGYDVDKVFCKVCDA
jgi:hypothetical protein